MLMNNTRVAFGTFEFVHKGHIKIVNHLVNNYLDKVIIIPTGNYWDKNDLVSVEDRINMLKLYENEKIITVNIDVDVDKIISFLESKIIKNDKFFLKIQQLGVDIEAKKLDNVSMDILSMGMSDDYQVAIEEGSNMVRIGSSIFGARQY